MRQYLRIATTFFIIGVWGCTLRTEPCPECIGVIYERPGAPYTCFHKSKDYCQCLNDNGCEAYIIIGQARGCNSHHAWVEWIHEGEPYWTDPTWKIGSYPASQWTDRKAMIKYRFDKAGNVIDLETFD